MATKEEIERLGTLIASRTTIHQFSTERVPEALVDQGLDLLRCAPNHRMTEPWRARVVGPVTRAKVVEVAIVAERAKAVASGKTLDEVAIRTKLKQSLLDPSHLVVMSQTLHRDAAVRREDYAAVSCGIQSMMLFLWGAGVGSKWSTGGVTREPEVHRLLGIDAEAEEVCGFVTIGYPGSAPAKPRRAKPREEIVRRFD